MRRLAGAVSVVAGLVLGLLAVGLTGRGAWAGTCVDEDVAEELEHCPGGTTAPPVAGRVDAEVKEEVAGAIGEAWDALAEMGPSEAPGGDEVTFFVLRALAQRRDAARAREVWAGLTRRWPRSPWATLGTLALGDMYASLGEEESGAAELCYLLVLQPAGVPPTGRVGGMPARPRPGPALSAYAAYRLAHLAWRRGKKGEGVEHFAEALRWVGTAEAPRRGEELDAIAAGMRSRVRRELPVAYAEGGDLRKERSFFAPLAAGRLLRQRLGTELLARGQYEEAKQVFSWLSLDAPGSCVDRAQLARAEAANGWGDRRATVGRFEDAVAAYRRFALGDATPRAKRQCGRALLRGLLGTAMQWHLRSMGGSVDDREGMMEGALALYRHAAREFTGREMERLHVAPGLPYVEFAAADLLFYLKRWDECGVAFGDIVADDPRGGLASEAARASSICFLHAAGESSPKGEEEAATYVPRALTDGERARLVAWNRHACWFAKDAEDSSFRGQYGDVLFARARVYEATGRWHIAARAYREMVEALPEHAHAAEAAAGYAGALHALGAKVQPKKMACIQELAEEVPDLVDRVCAKGSANRDGRSCRILREADCDLIGFQLSRESADMDDERGAERFLAYFDEHRGECTGSTGALLVAATFLEHQGRHARAIRVLKRLRDPANGLADSREAQLASLQIARNLAALGFFERAAEEYERFAAEGPELVGHGDALRDAGRLRLGLGQLEAALVDRATLAARGPSPALAQLDLALAKRHAADESWASVLGALDQGTLAALDGNVARRFEADALRARALAELGQGELARGAHDAIVARWEEPATVEAFMAAPSKEQRAILQSVSASLLWRADEERARATSASLAGREAAIERAAEAYDRVAELMPVPVPADTVSAAAATAEMWGDYAAALRAGDPHRARAVRRAVKLALACIDRSSAFQHVGAASRCETLLAKLAPSRYGATVAPRAMPLLLPGISARAVPLRRRRA